MNTKAMKKSKKQKIDKEAVKRIFESKLQKVDLKKVAKKSADDQRLLIKKYNKIVQLKSPSN